MKIIIDDRISDLLDDILSGLLKSTDNEMSKKIIIEVLESIPLEDMTIQYLVFFKLFKSMYDISLRFPTVDISLSKDLLDRHLQTSIDAIIDECDVKDFLEDITTDSDLSDLRIVIYNECLAKYDYLIELNKTISESILLLETLKEEAKTNLCIQLCKCSQQVLTDGVYINKIHYKGTDDYVKLQKEIPAIIDRRFKNKSSRIVISGSDSITESRAGTRLLRKLFDFNLCEIDNVAHVSVSDVVMLVGEEGTGKTQICIGTMSMQSIEANNGVLYISGENDTTKIRDMHISNYIYRKTGWQISWKEVQNLSLIKDEKVRRRVEIEIIEFAKMLEDKDTPLVIERTLPYQTFKDSAKAIIHEHHRKIHTVIIDDIGSMESVPIRVDGKFLSTKKEKIDHLIQECISLGDEEEVAVILVGHPNTETYNASSRGKDVGVAVGGLTKDTTKRADTVIYVSQTREMANSIFPRIRWLFTKIRDFRRDGVKLDYVLRTMFACSALQYKEQDQIQANEDLESYYR